MPYVVKKTSVLRSWWWKKVCPKHVELILEINKTDIVTSRWFLYYLTYIDDARWNTNQKRNVGRIFCELTKACDYVNHDIWLAKLHFYGIWGVSEDWFRFCLTIGRQKSRSKNQWIQLKMSSVTGAQWNMEFPKDQF